MKRSLVLAIVCTIAGCAPYATEPDLPALTRPALPAVPTAWQAAQEVVGEVQVGWIGRLNDPVLDELVREGLANNRDLAAALASVEQSQAIARQVRSGLFPAIDYSGSASEGGQVSGSSIDSYSAGISVGWEADVWGRVRASRNSADYAAVSAEADYVFAQYSLAAAIAQTYFLVVESSLQVAVAQKSLNALAETNRILVAQRAIGSADAYDESLSSANLATARATLVEAAGAQRLAQRALEVLVGRYPADAIASGSDLPPVPGIPEAGLPGDLLERRPDLIAAELAVASAFSNVGATKATRLPTISIGGSIDTVSGDLADVLDLDSGIWSLAASLLGPLFDAGLRRAQIDEASASQRQSIASYAQAALLAFQEVEDSLDQSAVLVERVTALADAAAAQNRAFELAQLRYRAGETDLLDVLQVQSNTLSADSALVTARREQLDEWINLNLALGGSW